MFIVKHAAANLRRNIGRNLLLGIVIFMILFIAGVSIVIHAASLNMIEDYKERFGSEVHIQNTDPQQSKKPTVKELLSYGSSEFLRTKAYLAKVGYNAEDKKALDDDDDPASLQGYLLGSSREDINDEFQSGTRKLVEGAVYKKPKECIISRKYADINHLQVGDTITIMGSSIENPMKQKLTISGIYDDLSLHSASSTYAIALTNRSNEIYASWETVMETEIFQRYGALDITMYIKEPSMLQEFEKELRAKGLPAAYQVTMDAAEYLKIIAPVEHLADISKSMMIGVCVLGSLLLILISVMVTKERTYEIGVLRSIGMKKKQVVYGLLIETMIITGICLMTGLGTAQLAADPIADALMQSQIAEKEADENSSVPMMDASLDLHTVLLLSLLATGLSLIASAGGVLYTVRYEPIKILSSRK